MVDISSQNPWWSDPEKIEEDVDYKRWKSSEIRWIPRVLEEISLEPYSLNIIFGPRQVGKTTLLKLIIKKLLENKVDPFSIFYFRCDALADFKELDSVIKEYLKIKRAKNLKNSFILLDEVTFPDQWYRAIKFRIDMGDLANDVLILTGSLSMYVKREVETFPGRKGKGKDFVMLPLSFSEFVEVAKKLRIMRAKNIAEIPSKVMDLYIMLDELKELFELYLISGGFPLAVRSILSQGKVTSEVLEAYISALRSDLFKLKVNEAIVKRILKAVIEKAPSRLSLNSIARELEIPSHKTVFRYLSILEELFVLKQLYYLDPNTALYRFRKERKVHLIDPMLYSALSQWCATNKPDESVIAESIVASHIARSHESGYWHNSREIDVVARENNELIGIEVKYKERPSPVKLKLGKLKRVLTLSKDEFDPESGIIPVSIFLALL